uniref:Uncharacterized protein n=1 Tax=Leptobrachium leishanense TaxID=445787 RepID=A0A8C5MCJ0_9ANUR
MFYTSNASISALSYWWLVAYTVTSLPSDSWFASLCGCWRGACWITSYISWLRGRAAREAIQTEYERWVQGRRTRSTQAPAPIELWTDLTCRMADSSEETLTKAFSQMLTIAATEPLGLIHSVPPKASLDASSNENHLGDAESSMSGPGLQGKNTPRRESGSSGDEPTSTEGGGEEPWKRLDFENIYKYLSRAATGGDLPKLTAEESAVLLHLLHSLPDQLESLNCNLLGSFLREKYSSLNEHLDPEETNQTETPIDATSSGASTGWKELGYCPLNPFLIPLELLRSKETD